MLKAIVEQSGRWAVDYGAGSLAGEKRRINHGVEMTPSMWLASAERLINLIAKLLAPLAYPVLLFSVLYLFLPQPLAKAIGLDNVAQPMRGVVAVALLASFATSVVLLVNWASHFVGEFIERIRQWWLIRGLSTEARLILGFVAQGVRDDTCWWKRTEGAQQLVDCGLFEVFNESGDTITIQPTPAGARLMDAHRTSLRRHANDSSNAHELKRLLNESQEARDSRRLRF